MLDSIEKVIIKDAFKAVFKNHGFEDKVEIKPSKYSSSLYIIPVAPPFHSNEYSFKISFHNEYGKEHVFLTVMREGNTWGTGYLMSPYITSATFLAKLIEKVLDEEAQEEFYPRDLGSYWM